MMRLWALLRVYLGVRRLARRRTASDATDTSKGLGEAALAWTQLLSTVAFQSLENLAYLSSRGVLGWDTASQAIARRWSARFLGVFVGSEIGRLVYQLFVANDASDKSRGATRKSLVRNVAWVICFPAPSCPSNRAPANMRCR
jgi:hypothetical protein